MVSEREREDISGERTKVRDLELKRPDIDEDDGELRGEHADEHQLRPHVHVLRRGVGENPFGRPNRLVEVVRVKRRCRKAIAEAGIRVSNLQALRARKPRVPTPGSDVFRGRRESVEGTRGETQRPACQWRGTGFGEATR